ncbi:uncharacterized protein DDB_G0284671-like isoform X2 [Dermacentor silvarum]|uniref:uncharacterized protein DDB_G0284671-like isoform X2 n=1 Tax=Dermacentor silvarum TaxID=543639 RepID=UPI001899E08A|nr:uncharacterized protein DDB_G0284671-like isoform X2 [Dermacentor silvarum]
MDPTATNALALAALLFLPLLQALCPRLAPDVISGKVIPCRYLCIKINFFELPSIVFSTERDGVLCSTLLLRRRGVCRNGGCVPFDSGEFKGAFGKAVAAVDTFTSGTFRKTAPEPGLPSGPTVDTSGSPYSTGSNTAAGPVLPVGSVATTPSVAGATAGASAPVSGLLHTLKTKIQLLNNPFDAGKTPSNFPNQMLNGETTGVPSRVNAVNFAGAGHKSESLASQTSPVVVPPDSLPKAGSTGVPATMPPMGNARSGQASTSLSTSSPSTGGTALGAGGSAGAASGGVSGAGAGTSLGQNTNAEPTLASIHGISPEA